MPPLLCGLFKKQWRLPKAVLRMLVNCTYNRLMTVALKRTQAAYIRECFNSPRAYLQWRRTSGPTSFSVVLCTPTSLPNGHSRCRRLRAESIEPPRIPTPLICSHRRPSSNHPVTRVCHRDTWTGSALETHVASRGRPA